MRESDDDDDENSILLPPAPSSTSLEDEEPSADFTPTPMYKFQMESLILLIQCLFLLYRVYFLSLSLLRLSSREVIGFKWNYFKVLLKLLEKSWDLRLQTDVPIYVYCTVHAYTQHKALLFLLYTNAQCIL